MKKFLVSLITIVTFGLLVSSPAFAMTLSPSSGSFPSSQNKVVSITAAPPSASAAAQLRLTINNAKVVSYSGPGGSVLAIGTCDAGGSSYRAVSSSRYEICVDLASTGGNLSNGASLGSITLKSLNSAGGTFTISGDSDNGYLLIDDSLSTKSGTLGTYTFAASNSSGSGSTTTNQVVPTTAGGQSTPNVTYLPNTAISDYMPGRGILGAAILVSGVVSLSVALKVFLIDKRRAVME